MLGWCAACAACVLAERAALDHGVLSLAQVVGETGEVEEPQKLRGPQQPLGDGMVHVAAAPHRIFRALPFEGDEDYPISPAAARSGRRNARPREPSDDGEAAPSPGGARSSRRQKSVRRIANLPSVTD